MPNRDADDQPVATPRRPRLLLVEDNESGLRSLSRLLKILGYETTSAKDGESAIAAMERDPSIDYVMTDLRLPDLDGREVVQAAHRLLRAPRIALMTGWDIDPDEPAKLGIDWVFLKPLEIANIVAQLREKPPADLASDAD